MFDPLVTGGASTGYYVVYLFSADMKSVYLSLIGRACSSLYKAKCGEGSLKTTAGKQAAAPFAFISHLAGALLVVELLRFEVDKMLSDRLNYLAFSPWHPPHSRLRQRLAKNPNCQCNQEDFIEAYKEAWPEYIIDQTSNEEKDA